MSETLLRRADRSLGSHVERRRRGGAFPGHWSLLLGQLALWSFVVLVATGAYLTVFFEPSSRTVMYEGSYVPLRDVPMTAAFRSVLDLTFDVRAGLLVRQTHHWAALVFVAAIVAHLARVFFTGAFRSPRRTNWVIGVTLLVLALGLGFTGYALPYDLLSGTGLRIASAVLLAVPVFGTLLAFLFFGGEPPDVDVIGRLFWLHVLVLPVLFVALLAVHLWLVRRQGPMQFAGSDRSPAAVVGPPVRWVYAVRSAAVLCSVVAVLVALGGLVQITPVWLYGPYQPAAVTTTAQPDWYLLWVEGALRTFPPWRVELFGHTLSEVFWPAVLLPLLVFVALYAWPFVHGRIRRGQGEVHLLQRPSEHPVRTATGVAVLTGYVVLTAAGAQDLFAERIGVSIPAVLWTFRVLLVLAPVLAWLLAYKTCTTLAGGSSGSGPPG